MAHCYVTAKRNWNSCDPVPKCIHHEGGQPFSPHLDSKSHPAISDICFARNDVWKLLKAVNSAKASGATLIPTYSGRSVLMPFFLGPQGHLQAITKYKSVSIGLAKSKHILYLQERSQAPRRELSSHFSRLCHMQTPRAYTVSTCETTCANTNF